MAFKITLPEIFTLTDAEYEALTQAWVKAIRVLPNHTILHKQDWFLESSYKADISPEDITFLAKSSERYFHERPYLNHESYIFITKKALDGKAKAITSTIFKSSVVPAGAINDKQFNSFIEKVGQFTKIIEDSGFIKVKPLTSNEIAGTSDKTGILERYCYLLSPNELPVIKDISLDHNLKVGDYTTQIFSLSDVENLPSQCSPTRQYDKYSTEKTKFHVGFATPLTQLLSCNHIYNQYIVIGDAQLTLKNLESKRLRLQSLSAYSRENSLSRDAVNDYLNESISEQRLPVQAHFNLITWTNNEQQIKEIRNNVSASLAQMDVKTKQESISTAQLFIAGIPGAAGYLPTFETFETFCEQAVCFFAQETSYQTSLSPVGLRLGDRITGFPLHTDISDEPVIKQICQNRAKFVLGPSGSGKSFFTNHYLRNYYEQGSHVLIIDVGHSYAGLCELVGGRYFTYSIDNPIAFNPFIVQGPIDTEKKESLKNLLLALWKRDNETYSQSEYVAISNALQLYFILLSSDHSILPGFNSFYEFIRDRFAPSLAGEGIHDKHFDIQNFLYVLKPYYKGGEYDFLLNAKENMDLVNERFLVFEIDSIQNHAILYKVTTIIIMEIFLSKIRRLKGIRKIILVEEAWKAIAKDSMAEYIKYLWKTIRKHYGEPVIVTQEVDDIISSNVIKDAIINNSDTKILLDQTKYINKFNQVQELLGLTDKDKTLILSMNKNNDPTKRYKEVFINLGGIISKVYRTEVSLEEYLCYTTEEKEKMLVQQYAKKYGSLQKGIQILAAEIRDKTISLTPVIFKNSA